MTFNRAYCHALSGLVLTGQAMTFEVRDRNNIWGETGSQRYEGDRARSLWVSLRVSGADEAICPISE
jgi:hypothetical protein